MAAPGRPRHVDGAGGGSGGTLAHMNLGAPELIILLVIVLVLFGGSKLPKLAKSLGEAKREFERNADEEPKQTTAKDADDL